MNGILVMKNICIKLTIAALFYLSSHVSSAEEYNTNLNININYKEIENEQIISLLNAMIYDIKKADAEIKKLASDKNQNIRKFAFWSKNKTYTNDANEVVSITVMFKKNKKTLFHGIKSFFKNQEKNKRIQKGYQIGYHNSKTISYFSPRNKFTSRCIRFSPNGNLIFFSISRKNDDNCVAYLRYNNNGKLKEKIYNK